MEIALILMGIALIGLLIWVWRLYDQTDSLLDQMISLAQHSVDRENWENEVFQKIDIKYEKTTKGLEAVNEDIRKLTDKIEEFNDLTADSLQAQIDSEKAWAEGVRAIAGYGMSIPTINTRGLGNE